MERLYPPVNGACKGKPVHWWYPVKTSTLSKAELAAIHARTQEALKICSECHIKDECLEYALEWEPFGIWGGVPETERHYMRHRMKIELKRDAYVSGGAKAIERMNPEAFAGNDE